MSGLSYGYGGIPINLFDDNSKRIRKENLDKTTDTLKRRFGDYIITPALLLKDRALSDFNPKADHTIHPVGFF